MALIGYIFLSLYFTWVCFVGLSHAPQKHTHALNCEKKISCFAHRTQFYQCPEVLELCFSMLLDITESLGRGACWTGPGYLWAQPRVLTILLLSLARCLLPALFSWPLPPTLHISGDFLPSKGLKSQGTQCPPLLR